MPDYWDKSCFFSRSSRVRERVYLGKNLIWNDKTSYILEKPSRVEYVIENKIRVLCRLTAKSVYKKLPLTND